jgi:hypothetical protein
MTEYMISNRPGTTPLPDLRSMLDAGQLEAYRVRGNGTVRLVRLLPVGSTGREVAEGIYDEVEDGRTIQAISRELHSSVPTVRRMLEALELTEEIEAGDWDDTWAELHGFAVEVVSADDLQDPPCQADAETAGRLAPGVGAERAAVVDAGVLFS